MFLQTIRRYKDIILYRTYAGIKSEGRRNYLGYLWFLLEPVLGTAVLYVAFTQITGRSGREYALFLIVGMIIWQWFESSVMLGSTAIKAKFGVLNQYDLPKYIFPVVSILVNTWKFACVFAVVLAAAALLGFPPNRHFVHLPLLLFVQLMLITGVTLPLSIGVTLMNDLLTVTSSVFRLLFFISGIFFPVSAVPESLLSFFFMNPMAVLIDSCRRVMLENRAPDFSLLGGAVVITAVLFLAGLLLHAHFDKKLLKLTNA
ncbi:MAG: ABC transporter permease [Opitutaceae bacterium]|jgi:lipopolysaccharide transport system permease protein|nr:ABC transporter permease [Opitutaceae bacterium]